MRLEVLISTLDQRNLSFYHGLFRDCPIPPPCLIVNQISDPSSVEIEGEDEHLRAGKDVKWIKLHGRGLSVSRNAAIRSTTGEIGVIADDDIIFLPRFDQKVISYHQQYSKYDIIIFEAMTPDGSPFRKYPKGIESVTKSGASGVSSIEITFKVKAVREKGLLFDECFGLGSGYPAGEEWIFIVDALRKGLKVLFVPEFIVVHAKSNSGSKFTKSRIMALGAVMYRVYGAQAYLRFLVFPKNIRKIHLKYHSFFAFIYFLLKGVIQYQFRNRVNQK